ncbi:unnamed protein product, partial [Scytosiphon promiscuus]
SYITDRLDADNGNLRQRPHRLVRAAVGFGVEQHSLRESATNCAFGRLAWMTKADYPATACLSTSTESL